MLLGEGVESSEHLREGKVRVEERVAPHNNRRLVIELEMVERELERTNSAKAGLGRWKSGGSIERMLFYFKEERVK